jgi:hypothetical protein
LEFYLADLHESRAMLALLYQAYSIVNAGLSGGLFLVKTSHANEPASAAATI